MQLGKWRQSSAITGQGIKYLLVGGTSALIEYGGFQLLFLLAGWNVAASNITATVAATVFNFASNRSFTFNSTARPVRSAVLYLVLFCCNTAFSTVVVDVLVGAGLSSLIAKLIPMACVTCWNFVLYRKVVFRS